MKFVNNIFGFLFSMFFLASCASTIKIASVAEKNSEGDYLLKWEVSPDVEGKIDIFSASSDTTLKDFTPIRSKLVEEQFALLNPIGSGLREFFILKTSGVTSGIISNRSIEMDRIHNFRDLGGYFTSDEKQLRWGRVYRSGHLSNTNLYDQDRLKQLGIRTIIDFRTEEDRKAHPYFLNITKVNIPVIPGDIEVLKNEILKGNSSRSETIIKIQNAYKEMVENNADKFADMFDVLLDENNYPVLLSSFLGKDRVGVASALLLYALGVLDYTVEEDYLASNKYIDPKKTFNLSDTIPEPIQESLTALFTANNAYLRYAFDYIKENYGTVDNYLEKKVRVSKGKTIILRKLMLYQP